MYTTYDPRQDSINSESHALASMNTPHKHSTQFLGSSTCNNHICQSGSKSKCESKQETADEG